MKCLVTAGLFWLSAMYGVAQPGLSSSPEGVKFITSDIENFWAAFDQAKGKDRDERLEIFQRVYIDQASPGLMSYIEKRSKKVETLVDGVYDLQPFYESIRPEMQRIEEYQREIKAGFYALKYLYPEAVYPDVYFFVWYIFDSGSTISDQGLLLTMEAHSVSEDSPLDKFPEVQHELVRSMNIENMPITIAHELIHVQQPDTKTNNLLERAVKEGAADFVAALVTGGNATAVAHDYANPREEQLWREFEQKMYGQDYAGWVGIPSDRPAGLAYWMGYKIVEAYYNQQPDLREAVKEIIKTTDYQGIFDRSGYADRFQ